MNQIQTYNTVIHFKPESSFADRERHLHQQIHLIKESLIKSGQVPIEHQINTKSDLKASISIFYQKQS